VVNFFPAAAAQLTVLQMRGEIRRPACSLAAWYHTLSNVSTVQVCS